MDLISFQVLQMLLCIIICFVKPKVKCVVEWLYVWPKAPSLPAHGSEEGWCLVGGQEAPPD